MSCYVISVTGGSARERAAASVALRGHLSSSQLEGFRHAGSGWAEESGACLTAVLVQRKKDLNKAARAFEFPEDLSYSIDSGDPLKDLNAEDELLAEMAAQAADEDEEDEGDAESDDEGASEDDEEESA